MWKLVGLAMLVSRVAMANTSEERVYYANEVDEDSVRETMNPNRLGVQLGFPEGFVSDYEAAPSPHHSENVSFLDSSRLKSETKRPIVRVNLIDDRSSKHREAFASLATLLYWPGQDQGGGSGDAEANPRSPGRASTPFSPWGGKRDPERYKTIAKIRRPVRVPFNSWGGKRNGEALESLKRNPLLTWEGKKTPPFNSWGGKRASVVLPVGYDASPRYPTDSASEENDSDFLRNLENSERVQHPRIFIDENSVKLVSGRLASSSKADATPSGKSLPEVDSPRVSSWDVYRRSRSRYGDKEKPGVDYSLNFRKIGPLAPWME